MTSKAINGSYSAAYAYRYGDKLCSVASDFPDEGNVAYEYGGDGKRRERTSGGATTLYRWDLGWNMINEENSLGALTRTYVMDDPGAMAATILADVSGTNPATGTPRYYAHDNLGSTRALWASNKSSLGSYEYTPYGSVYAATGASIATLGGAFTGKPWDPTAQLYYFPYRYYSPDLARWLTRDPLGMEDGPNDYSYISGRPVVFIDPEGTAGYVGPHFRLHGNWCGPGWSAGRRTKDEPLTSDEWKNVGFTDVVDKCCKYHDACYAGIKVSTGELLPKDKRKSQEDCDDRMCRCLDRYDPNGPDCLDDYLKNPNLKETWGAVHSAFKCTLKKRMREQAAANKKK